MTTFSIRLKQAMEARNLKQIDLSHMTGLDKSLISNYLKGSYQARQDNIHILSIALDVSEAWLMGYDVSPNRTQESEKNDDELMKEFVHLFELLNDTQKSLIIAQIKGILNNK